jgi:uncharacterized protein
MGNQSRQVHVQVKPSAKTDAVERLDDGKLRVSVKATPQEGKANAAVVKLLAKHFGVPQRAVMLKRGASSREKVFEVAMPGDRN